MFGRVLLPTRLDSCFFQPGLNGAVSKTNIAEPVFAGHLVLNSLESSSAENEAVK